MRYDLALALVYGGITIAAPTSDLDLETRGTTFPFTKVIAFGDDFTDNTDGTEYNLSFLKWYANAGFSFRVLRTRNHGKLPDRGGQEPLGIRNMDRRPRRSHIPCKVTRHASEV